MEKLRNFIQNLQQVSLKDIDWSVLSDWEYLTEKSPNDVFIYEQWIYVFVLISFFLSIISFRFIAGLYLEEKPKYRFVRKVAFMWFVNTILVLLYNLLRAEGVEFLSMRIFLAIFSFAYILILLYIPVYIVRILPKRMKRFREARTRDKYKNRKK